MLDPKSHYDTHLAAFYAWSLGGTDAAIDDAERFLDTLPLPPAPARVLDLGAGFGATALPLARRGYGVVAVDSSHALLDSIAVQAGSTTIELVHDDLLAYARTTLERFDVVLCLGDTLPHLESHDDVDALLAAIARLLRPGGMAVVSYRPKRDLAPPDRFVLVRADGSRTLTAVLEPLDERTQVVWDLLHEHDGAQTTMKVSGYRKLRLDPAWIAERARGHGLELEEAPSRRGMLVTIMRAG